MCTYQVTNDYYLKEEVLITFDVCRGCLPTYILCYVLIYFFHYITVATTVGTAVAFLMVPMRGLGQDSWKIAAALMGRHIGGGICKDDLFHVTLFMSFLYNIKNIKSHSVHVPKSENFVLKLGHHSMFIFGCRPFRIAIAERSNWLSFSHM